MAETSQPTKGIRNVTYTPKGRKPDATSPRVCILASHPDIADAYGALQPQELLNLAREFGVVEEAGLWVENRRLSRMDFVRPWKSCNYTLQPMSPAKNKKFYPYNDMRIQALRFVRAYSAYNRTAVLVVNGEPDLDLLQLVAELQNAGVRVVRFALDAKVTRLDANIDMVVSVRAAMKGAFDLFAPHRAGVVERLRQLDPKSYNLFGNILSIGSSSKPGKTRLQLERRVMEASEPLPLVVISMLAILNERQRCRGPKPVVPLNKIWAQLEPYGIPRAEFLHALELLLEEGTLDSENTLLVNARFARQAEDQAFSLGAALWEGFRLMRPSNITNRILTTLEIISSGAIPEDSKMMGDFRAFLSLQGPADAEMRRYLYQSWGLTTQGIVEFERRLSEVRETMSFDDSAEPVSEDPHPKLAACLPTGQANDEGLNSDPDGLRQAS